MSSRSDKNHSIMDMFDKIELNDKNKKDKDFIKRYGQIKSYVELQQLLKESAPNIWNIVLKNRYTSELPKLTEPEKRKCKAWQEAYSKYKSEMKSIVKKKK